MQLQPLRFGAVKMSLIDAANANGHGLLVKDEALSKQLGREVRLLVEGYNGLSKNAQGEDIITLSVRYQDGAMSDQRDYFITGLQPADTMDKLWDVMAEANVQGIDVVP